MAAEPKAGPTKPALPPLVGDEKSLDAPPAQHAQHGGRWDPKTGRTTMEVVHVPITVRESEVVAQRELLAVLRLVNTGKVAVSVKTLRPSADAVRAVAAILEGGDFYADQDPEAPSSAGPIRAFAWPLLLQAGGLAKLEEKRLQLTPAGRKALSAPPAETIRHLWKKWSTTRLLDELSRIDCVKGQTGKDGRRSLTAVTGRRQSVGVALARCATQRWLSVDDFIHGLKHSVHGFEVSRRPWNLYILEPGYGALDYDGDVLLRQRYTFCVMLEYAATLGMLDVACVPPAGNRQEYGALWGTDELPFLSRYDGLVYFRVNRLGAYALGCASEYTPPAVKAPTCPPYPPPPRSNCAPCARATAAVPRAPRC